MIIMCCINFVCTKNIVSWIMWTSTNNTSREVYSYSINSSSRYETLVSDIYKKKKKIKLSNIVGNKVTLKTINEVQRKVLC